MPWGTGTEKKAKAAKEEPCPKGKEVPTVKEGPKHAVDLRKTYEILNIVSASIRPTPKKKDGPAFEADGRRYFD